MYTLNTRKFFCFWLNKDPEVFLRLENKIRLIELKEKNPDLQLTYIYHRSFLSEKAFQEMKDFCNYFKIQYVNFEDIKVETDLENKLLEFAGLEAEHWKNNSGGNPAACSDLLRWSQSLLEKYGHYIDLDCQLNIQGLPETIQVDKPLLVQAGLFEGNYWFNNDLVAAATKDGKLDPDALEKIIQVQETLVMKHQPLYLYNFLDFCPDGLYPGLFVEHFLEPWLESKGSAISIYALRQYIETLGIQDFLKHCLFADPDVNSKAFKYVTFIQKTLDINISSELKEILDNQTSFPDVILCKQTDLLEEIHGLFVLCCDKGKWLENAETPVENSKVFLQRRFIHSVYSFAVEHISGPAALRDMFEPEDGLAHTPLAGRILTPQSPGATIIPDISWSILGQENLKNREKELQQRISNEVQTFNQFVAENSDQQASLVTTNQNPHDPKLLLFMLKYGVVGSLSKPKEANHNLIVRMTH